MTWADRLIKRIDIQYKNGYCFNDDLISAVLKENEKIHKEALEEELKLINTDLTLKELIQENESIAFRELVRKCEELKWKKN